MQKKQRSSSSVAGPGFPITVEGAQLKSTGDGIAIEALSILDEGLRPVEDDK